MSGLVGLISTQFEESKTIFLPRRKLTFLFGKGDLNMWQFAVSEPNVEGLPLDLFASSEGLVGEVLAGCLLGHNSHKMMEF